MKLSSTASPLFGSEDMYHHHQQHPFFGHSHSHSHLHRRPFTPSPSPFHRSVVTIPILDPTQPPATHALPSLDPSIAATRIQARFRGFSVRRHHPLSLLRTIASVCQQLDAFEEDIHTPQFVHRIRSDDKERLRVSESIMNLLLRLDSVQGAVPEIRSRRKEASRKAIMLQDSIDAMIQQQEGEAPNLDAQADMTLLSCESSRQGPSSAADTNDDGERNTTVCVDASGDLLNSTGSDHDENENFVSEKASGQCTSTTSSEDSVPLKSGLDASTNPDPDIGCDSLSVDDEHAKLLDEDQNHDMKEIPRKRSINGMADGIHKSETVSRCTGETSIVEGGIIIEPKESAVTDLHLCINATESHQNVPASTPLQQSTVCLDGMEDQQKESIICSQMQGCTDFCLDGTEDQQKELINRSQMQGCTSLCLDGTEDQQKESINCSKMQGCTDLCLDGMEKGPFTHLQECINVCINEEENQHQSKQEEKNSIEAERNAQSSGQLLQQIADDCNQLRFLIGKLISQTRAQNKAICELNGRIEMLEEQQKQSVQCKQQQRQSSKKTGIRKGLNKKMKARPRTIRGFSYDESF